MAVFSVRFSHDSSEILCGSSDYRIHIFDIATEKRIVSIEQAHGDDVNSVCYGDNDHLIYSGGDDGIVKVRIDFNLTKERPQAVFTILTNG